MEPRRAAERGWDTVPGPCPNRAPLRVAVTPPITAFVYRTTGFEEYPSMTRTRSSAVAAFALALLVAAPAAAEESPLAQVPEQAPMVVYVHGFKRAQDRLITMVENALPDLAPKVRAGIDDGLKKGLEGRQLKGLSPDGAIFVVFTELPKQGEEVPMAAIIAQVTSYAEFRDGILKEKERKTLKAESGYEVATLEDDKDVYFVDRKGWVVATPRQEAAKQLAKAPQRGLEGKLGEADSKRLLDADVAVYVDTAAINKAYGDKIKQSRVLLEAVFEQAAKQQGGGAMKGMMEMAKQMGGAVLDALEDSRTAVLAVEFRSEGLALHGGATMASDSKSGTFLKTFKPAALDGLAALPAGQMFYTDMEMNPALTKAFLPFWAGAFSGEGEPSQEAKDALAELTEAKLRTAASAVGMPTAGLAVSDYVDPAKAVEGQLKLYRSLKADGGIQFMPIKEKPEIKTNARDYRGFKLHHVHLVWDWEKMKTFAGAPGMEESLKKVMGESLDIWFGTNGKVYVQASAKDWASAQRFLNAYLDGKDTLGQQAAYRDARKQLPAQATMLVLIDMPQYLRVIMEYVQVMMAAQLGKEPPKAPAVQGKAGYVAIMVTLEPGRGGFDLWLPGTAVAEARKVFESLKPAAGP
jgi:hypothetical protein